MKLRLPRPNSIDYSVFPVAYVKNRIKDSLSPVGLESGETTCCNEIVKASQYGFDEDCPCCKRPVDWSKENLIKAIEGYQANADFFVSQAKMQQDASLMKIAQSSASIEELISKILEDSEYSEYKDCEIKQSFISTLQEEPFTTCAKHYCLNLSEDKFVDIKVSEDSIFFKESEGYWKWISVGEEAERDYVCDLISNIKLDASCISSFIQRELSKEDTVEKLQERRKAHALSEARTSYNQIFKHKQIDISKALELGKQLGKREDLILRDVCHALKPSSIYKNRIKLVVDGENATIVLGESKLETVDKTRGTRYVASPIVTFDSNLLEDKSSRVFLFLESSHSEHAEDFSRYEQEVFVPLLVDGMDDSLISDFLLRNVVHLDEAEAEEQAWDSDSDAEDILEEAFQDVVDDANISVAPYYSSDGTLKFEILLSEDEDELSYNHPLLQSISDTYTLTSLEAKAVEELFRDRLQELIIEAKQEDYE